MHVYDSSNALNAPANSNSTNSELAGLDTFHNKYSNTLDQTKENYKGELEKAKKPINERLTWMDYASVCSEESLHGSGATKIIYLKCNNAS